MSPSELVGPSPVTSNGTEATEIDDEISEEALDRPSAANPGPQPQVRAHLVLDARIYQTNPPQLMMLGTNISDSIRKELAGESLSVIHAPENFGSFVWSPCLEHDLSQPSC